MSDGLFPEPSAAFYEREPRARELRGVCLQALEAAEAVLMQRDEMGPSRLLDFNWRLAELGIVPGMHEIADDVSGAEAAAKKERLAADPVLAAEFIAGQVRTLLSESGGVASATGSGGASRAR